MQVHELMTEDVKTCRPSDTLSAAAQRMWDGDIGCVPVVDATGTLVGMITDRDICMAACISGRDLHSLVVGDVMSKQVHTCESNETIALAQERMRQHQVRRMPVLERGRLAGVLSLNDLASAAGERKRSNGGQVSFQDVAITLARIGEHRHGVTGRREPRTQPAAQSGTGPTL